MQLLQGGNKKINNLKRFREIFLFILTKQCGELKFTALFAAT